MGDSRWAFTEPELNFTHYINGINESRPLLCIIGAKQVQGQTCRKQQSFIRNRVLALFILDHASGHVDDEKGRRPPRLNRLFDMWTCVGLLSAHVADALGNRVHFSMV
jgi:hypothetical protein